MADIEISENKAQCEEAQKRLTECIGEIERSYTSILKFATSEETAWWKGTKHDEFVTEMEKRKEQFDMFTRTVHREEQFFGHWKETLAKLNNIFEDLLSSVNRLD